MSQALKARNNLGTVMRHHRDDEAAVTAARQQLAVAKITEYIERVVAEAPPLTPEMRDRLALLLRGAA